MKRNINLILLIILNVVFLGGFFNTSNATNQNSEMANIDINAEYEYNEKTNTVLVKVISSKQLKDTKKKWKLSSDKLTYSYEFDNNTTYFTMFEDIDGYKKEIEIKVNQVKERNLELEVNYGKYDSENNTVLVEIKANNQLKNTKKNWKISEDKMIYSYTFNNNSDYTTSFEDVQGNKASAKIKITEIDDKAPILDVKYEHTEGINNVKVIITSNEPLKATKKNWTLAQDKMSYSYDFKDNTNYITEFQDLYGNSAKINIEVTQIDKEEPKIAIKYTHNDDNTVQVDLISNEKLKTDKKNWIYNEEEKTYTYTFKDDTNYITTVQDLCGNKTQVQIKAIKKIYSYPGTPNIKIKYLYSSYENVKVEMVSNIQFQNTKPTWILSEDGYRYTKEFREYNVYTTSIKDVQGHERIMNIIVDQIPKIIKCEEGIYGVSGLKNIGDKRGSNLKYYKIGDGPNVFFGTFSVHGFEDLYEHDGAALTRIAEDFKNKLIQMQDIELDKKWTIYIFPCVNPDGQVYGTEHSGPGRTTLTSLAPTNQGIDLNRCWHIAGTNYTRYIQKRNYNGTAGFQATEASSLRDFLVNHKSAKGTTVLVDLHGWLNETLGDNEIGSYYRTQYELPSHNPNYGTGYLINWARATLGARSTLVELPEYDSNSTKYINATINMLRGI